MMLFKFKFMIVFLFLGQLILAQTNIVGKLKNHSGKSAVLMGSNHLQNPQKIGQIHASGEFSVEVGQDYYREIMKQYRERRSKHPNSPRLPTFKHRYASKRGALKIQNSDQLIIKLMGLKGLVVKRKENLLGKIYLLSERDFEKSRRFHYRANAKTGFSIDWYYVKKPLKAYGKIETTANVASSEENFKRHTKLELNLKPGWNMVKQEVTKVYKASNGRFFVKELWLKSLNKVPENAQYVFIENQKR